MSQKHHHHTQNILTRKSAAELRFKKDFACAVKYLKENKVDGILAKLEKLDVVIYISDANNLIKGDKSSCFSKDKNTIFWNSRQAFSSTDAVLLSPTTILNHEADHALQSYTNYAKWQNDIRYDVNNPYESKEEERVITKSEQRTAKALGEIKIGEITRKDHKSTYIIIVDSPTSVVTNEEGIIIKPQNR